MGFIGTCKGYTGGPMQENDPAEFGMARLVHFVLPSCWYR